MSENLYQKIVESSKTDNKEEAKETLITYLVFKIGKENYAVESNEVREILRNNEKQKEMQSSWLDRLKFWKKKQ